MTFPRSFNLTQLSKAHSTHRSRTQQTQKTLIWFFEMPLRASYLFFAYAHLWGTQQN
jgi:hypothetical protein